jgi:uroporphyrinogen-III synthase
MGDRPTVAVTRAEEDARALADALARVGLDAVSTPLISVVQRPAEWLGAQLLAAPGFDWIVCTSRNAVDALSAAAPPGSEARRRLEGVRVAAVGERTAGALATHGWRAAVVPEVSDAAHLARALLAEDATPARRVLFPRADEAREDVPTILRAAGWTVDDVACYETRPRPDGGAALSAALAAGEVQAVALASGSAARALAQLVPRSLWGVARLVSIGPATTAAARDAGLVVSAEATTPRLEALAQAVRHILIELPTHA